MSQRSRAAHRAFRNIGPVALLGALMAMSLWCTPADASIHHHRRAFARPFLSLTDPGKDAALIVDGETGRALYARNADALRHPASLTKMMTLYLLFEQLKSGQMTLATPLYVSEHAAIQPRTKLNLRAGSTIPVDAAIKAVVVLSANDVAVTIAEAIGGSESHFAEMMTAKARSWGMTHTYYDNASGLPDPLQITSASDLAILARHVAYDFPQYFHYFSTYSFSYRGATFFTHDNLIGRYMGADGIKTGYTGASGFNLVSSVVRNGVHIIGVVMGGVTARRRDSEMVRLLDDTFASITRNPRLAARENIPWQAVADAASARPVIAGFALGNDAVSPVPLAAPPMNNAAIALGNGVGAAEDEDAAESRPDAAYDAMKADPGSVKQPAAAEPAPSPESGRFITVQSPPPPPKGAAAHGDVAHLDLKAPGTVQPALQSAAAHTDLAHIDLKAPAAVQPSLQSAAAHTDLAHLDMKATLNAVQLNAPRPQPKPSMQLAEYEPPELQLAAPRSHESNSRRHKGVYSSGAVGGDPLPTGSLDWTIQIGAFDDAASARAELSAYAGRSMDVLGQVARIVAPFQSNEGHTLYRARFGPFGERDARQVCQLLTVRGETCFAALASSD